MFYGNLTLFLLQLILDRESKTCICQISVLVMFTLSSELVNHHKNGLVIFPISKS